MSLTPLRRRSRRTRAEMNVVPYIDVMLVLLVIFMVTAPMIQTGVLKLPSVGSVSQPEAPPIVVQLDTQGQLTTQAGAETLTHTNSAALIQWLNKRAQTDGYVSIDERVRKFEPQTVTVAGIQGIVQPDEQQRYDAALKLFNDGTYPAAQSAMASLSGRYPKTVYMPFIQFYQGTAAYANRDYKTATALLQNVLKKYPEFERTSDTLLNLANTLIENGQKPVAQKLLNDLLIKFPNTDNAKVAQDLLLQLSK